MLWLHPKSGSVHFSASLLQWKVSVPLHRIRKYPSLPITVSIPSGSFSIISMHRAFFQCFHDLFSGGIRFAHPHILQNRHFQKLTVLKYKGNRSPSDSLHRQSLRHPHRRCLYCPSVTSKNLAIRLANVVLPPPDGPTNATCSPVL